MIEALSKDTDILFYNVFGTVELLEDRVKVKAHFIRKGVHQSRSLSFESNDLQNFQHPLIYSFGAWVAGQNDYHLAFEEREDYDQAFFELNRKFITEKVHLVLSDMVGAITL